MKTHAPNLHPARKTKKPGRGRAKTVEFVSVDDAAVTDEQQRANLAGTTAALAAAEGRLAGMTRWQADQDGGRAEVDALRGEVARLEVELMPMPAAMGLSFVEQDVPVELIATTGNHRERIDDVGLRQLARSIQIHGLQQRVGLRQAGDGYELIFGARRLAASKLAGLAAIPAKVYAGDLTAAQVEILRTIENFGRQDLTPVEKALAVARTIDAIESTRAPTPDETRGRREAALTLTTAIDAAGGLHAYVGQQLGFAERWIRDHAYVAALGGRARELLAAERITIGHARELAKLGDKDAADRVAIDCARDEHGLGGLGVEYARRRVVEHLRSLRGVPWKLNVAFGKGTPGCTGHACVTCPYNSKSDPDLFGGAIADEPEAGTCTNEVCFKAKAEITTRDIDKVVRKVAPKVEAGKVEATESGIREWVPDHVRESSAARRVKKETTPVGKPEAVDAQPPAAPPKASREEVAQRKLHDALIVHGHRVEQAMKVAVDCDVSGRRMMAMALLEMIPFDGFHQGWGDADDLSPGDLATLTLAADDASLGTLAAQAVKSDQWAGHVFEDFNWGPESRQVFVDAWKLDVPPPPTLADFLPKPKPAKAEKPAARAAKTPAAPTTADDAPAGDTVHLLNGTGKPLGVIGTGITATSLAAAIAACHFRPDRPDEPFEDVARVGEVFELHGSEFNTWAALRARHKKVDADAIPYEGLRVTAGEDGELTRSFGPNDQRLTAIVATPPAASATTRPLPKPDGSPCSASELGLEPNALRAAVHPARPEPKDRGVDAEPGTVPVVRVHGFAFWADSALYTNDYESVSLRPLYPEDDWGAGPKATRWAELDWKALGYCTGVLCRDRSRPKDAARYVVGPIEESIEVVVAGTKPAPATPVAPPFSEDAQIFTPAELGVTLADLGRADCRDALASAGVGGTAGPHVPEITTVADASGTPFAVVGRAAVRGRDCWRLLTLCAASSPRGRTPESGSRPTFVGQATAARAARGEFDGAMVKVGKAWRSLVAGDERPVYVENVAPPPRETQATELSRAR